MSHFLNRTSTRIAVGLATAAVLSVGGAAVASSPAEAAHGTGPGPARHPNDDNVDVDRAAPVIVDLTTTIKAPLRTVWHQHTNINAWPTWQADVSHAVLNGPLRPGTTFDWETHSLKVASTIKQVVPMRRIVWGGPAAGIEGIHVWTFTRTARGTVVHTTESWSGAPVDADPDALREALTASLTTWLQRLKETSEAAR